MSFYCLLHALISGVLTRIGHKVLLRFVLHSVKCLMLVFVLFIVKHILFSWGGCKIFGVFFNIESALAVHQLPTRRQILNSRRGFLGLKIGISL